MKKKLIAALEKCAEAHHAKGELYDYAPGDTQFAVMADSVPVIADLRMIAEAFFGTSRGIVCPDHSWGYVNVLLDAEPMLPEANEHLLRLALPKGTELN